MWLGLTGEFSKPVFKWLKLKEAGFRGRRLREKPHGQRLLWLRTPTLTPVIYKGQQLTCGLSELLL